MNGKVINFKTNCINNIKILLYIKILNNIKFKQT